MTLLNRIFDLYIDLNITLAITALVWLGAKLLMARFGNKLDYHGPASPVERAVRRHRAVAAGGRCRLIVTC
jgi:hypothetical protein